MSEYDRWGAVAGDTNAHAIMADRKRQRGGEAWGTGLAQLALIGFAIWYGSSGSPAALAWLIVAAVWAINANTASDLSATHTFVLIAERRAQLIEQAIREQADRIHDLGHDVREALKAGHGSLEP